MKRDILGTNYYNSIPMEKIVCEGSENFDGCFAEAEATANATGKSLFLLFTGAKVSETGILNLLHACMHVFIKVTIIANIRFKLVSRLQRC